MLQLRPHPAGEQGAAAPLTIGVVPFVDDRPNPQVLGKRVLSNGQEEPILLQSPSPSEDVTYILRRSLKARGIQVVELSDWEPAPKNLKDLPEDVDIAITGRIEALEVEAHSSVFETSISYRVQLSAHLGLKNQGKVLTKSVKVLPEETILRFKPQKLEDTLNEALAEGLGLLVETAISSSSQG